MAKSVGKISRKKGMLYYVDKDGFVREMSPKRGKSKKR